MLELENKPKNAEEAIKAGYKEVAVIKKGGKIDFQKILN